MLPAQLWDVRAKTGAGRAQPGTAEREVGSSSVSLSPDSAAGLAGFVPVSPLGPLAVKTRTGFRRLRARRDFSDESVIRLGSFLSL